MSEYAHRPRKEIMAHYAKHVQAMTAEGLHEKSDIAAELAWRDAQIEGLRNAAVDLITQVNNVVETDEVSTEAMERILYMTKR